MFSSVFLTQKEKKRRDAPRKSSSGTHLDGFIQKEMHTKKNEIISKTWIEKKLNILVQSAVLSSHGEFLKHYSLKYAETVNHAFERV